MNYWLGEIESQNVIELINDFFDYDHEIGRLRWTLNKQNWDRLPAPMQRKVRMGEVAGTVRPSAGYEIKVDNVRRKALPLIWQHCTGTRRRVMTIQPGETRFSIDNLCLLPQGNSKAPKDRAKNKTVISWSYARDRYTLVKVDADYNKQVLSYHDTLEDAQHALKQPTVSFL